MKHFEGMLIMAALLTKPFINEFHILESALEDIKATGKKVDRCSISKILDDNTHRLALLIDTICEIKGLIFEPSVYHCLDELEMELEKLQEDHIFLAEEFKGYLYCPALDGLED